MALKVVNSSSNVKLTVGNNYGGFQGSTYNPQKTAPVQTIQPAAPAKVIQPAAPGRIIQPAAPAKVVQPAATAAQVAAAAEAVRQAAIAEAARQKEVKRGEVQGQINLKVATNVNNAKLTVANPTWAGKLIVGKSPKLPKINLPVDTRSEYDKEYAKAYQEALAEYEKQKKPSNQPFWQKLGDKLSFGQDRRDMGAREYAAKRASEVADKKIAEYEKTLKGFLSAQAAKRAEIEGKKFTTQGEFDAAVKLYTDWENSQISNLEKSRAYITAQLDAFGSASQSKLTSKVAKTASSINRNIIQGAPGKALGNVWQYTLGQGSKNAPSLVTAPSRVINWLGNLNTKDRNIYQTGGGSTNRAGSGLNAWQATYNQRNFNIRPWTDVAYDKNKAEKMFGKEAKKAADDYRRNPAKVGSKFWNDMQKQGGADQFGNYDYQLKRFWEDHNRYNRFKNSGLELAADPLNYVGLGEIADGAKGVTKAFGFSDKLAEAGRASKATSWLFKGADALSSSKAAALKKVVESKPVQWLFSEHKSPEAKLGDAIDVAKKIQGSAQNEVFARINALNKKLAGSGGKKLDVSIFDDLRNLTDSEAKVLQRMTDGKLSATDRLMLVGRNNAPIREKLQNIALKWQDFTEQMKLADNVKNTRFGAGKRTYSPATAWIKEKEGNLDNYNFRLFKKGKKPQSQSDFYQGAVDRYFKSGLDDDFASRQIEKAGRWKLERDTLLKKYDDAINPARAEIDRLYAKTKSPFNKIRKAAGTPMKLWKQSVLKFRPAWTVNNVLYNTQAGALAGGAGSIAEQVKMLNPRYWRKAMDESRHVFGGNLEKEIGGGRLNKFYNGVEDWSRVAAGRAAMKKGLTQEQALKRVNKYLFDYTTKNWERPLKAAVPFWSFQKNLAKAAVNMPFDRPLASVGYNRLDRYQHTQYDKDFATMIPELKKMGYTDEEIAKMKEQNAKYFDGRLKVGNKWITTPFNAFSEKGMQNFGFNPFVSAAGEAADATDSFNRPLKGKDASFWRRLVSKFPQADLAAQFMSKPSRTAWIGKPGSEGYGLTKEKQGADKTKPNYDRNLDPKAKVAQNTAAFFGVPRSMEFDKNGFLTGKRLQKASSEYFSTNWKDMEYPEQQKKQKELFDKFGITADDFFKGVLAKYDTATTKEIKGQKESAAAANKKLFEEYAAQPKGTRNLWATNKLHELVNSGYFKSNPFLKSFKWIDPTTVAKADKQAIVSKAVKTGDWSAYRAKYGLTQKQKDYEYATKTGDWSKWVAKYGKSEKAKARDLAVATGDWTAYADKYGVVKKETPYKFDGKYFKSAETMQKYKEGMFWYKYAMADPEDRKKLLADNPQYNTRANWTRQQWTDWRKDKNSANLAKLKTLPTVEAMLASFRATNKKTASAFMAKTAPKPKKVIWKLS